MDRLMLPVINEFFFNNSGTDTVEYIEVYFPALYTGGPLYVLQVEGDVAANTTQRGRIDGVYAVANAGAGGYTVVTVNPANPGALENGAFTLLLVTAEPAPGISSADDDGNDIDRNNDGVIDAGVPFTILDAVGIADDAVDTTYAGTVRLTNIPSGPNAVGGFSRLPNGIDTDSNADWTPHDQALDPNNDLDPTPDAGEARNTPGVANAPEIEFVPLPPQFVVSIPINNEVAEGGAGNSFSVALSSQPTADVILPVTPDAQLSTSVAELTFTVANWNVAQTVFVNAVDDADAEGTHAGSVVLGAAESTDADYDGQDPIDPLFSILDNDTPVVITPIAEIQGAAHASPLAGQVVVTTGIVTARSNNGFWMQDPTPDDDSRTSEGIFVFTGSGPALSVGDAVQVEGTVSEFIRTTTTPGHLSITQLTSPTFTVLSSGNTLPAAVVIGTDRIPPTEITDSDNLMVFNPDVDGVDFWESLEGMRVELPDAIAIGPSFNSTSTTNRAETFAVANRGAGATSLNDAGGLTLSETDDNPERVAVQANQQVLPGADFVTKVGDLLGSVVGVLDYDNRGNFEIILTQAITVTDGGLVKEAGAIARGDAIHLSVGTYNVENLAGNGPQAKFDALGLDIVSVLNLPDIIALQEIQDNNGTTNDGTVAADITYSRLIASINAAAIAAGITDLPNYQVLNIDPVNNTSGGAPGGNIRVGFLYDSDRVDVVAGSLRQVDQGNLAAWDQSRIPLAADFVFNGHIITVVNNHWASKGGSSPQFGTIQPLLNGSEDQRVLQAAAVKAFVDAELAGDPAANVIVMGDLNEFAWEDSLQIVTGIAAGNQVLFDLYELTEPDPVERYEYTFDGNHQILDHLLVSASLVDTGFEFQSIQINSQFPAAQRNSDHDPAVARFALPASVADALDFTFWRTAVFPGSPPATAWRDPATGVLYTAAAGGEQDSSADDDTATGASDSRFLSSAGDVGISRVDFASGQALGTAGGPPVATLDWTDPGTALLRLLTTWNSIKTVAIREFTGDALSIEGFVDVLADLAETEQDLLLVLDGIKRGTVTTGSGDDQITIGFDSNETRWSNTVVIDAGAGNDIITVGAASRNYTSGRWTLADSSSFVTGGEGNDTLLGSASYDTAVFRGNAADYIITVSGELTLVTDIDVTDGDEGTDTLFAFNALQFNDATLTNSGGIWS